jgi:hypothetical protein
MPENSGFLVSPAKSVGPQPIIITNLSDDPVNFTLTPVGTVMAGGYCQPTSQKVGWLHVPSTAKVAPHQSLSLPVTVTGRHGTADVAVRVQPWASSQGVGVSFVSYAQEIIGPLGGGKGCAVMKGATVQAQPVAATSGIGPGAISGMAAGALGLAALGIALKRLATGRRSYHNRASHR